MQMTLPHAKRSRLSKNVSNVLREFRTVYADAVFANMTDADWPVVSRKRRLTWRSAQRLSLADAARCYGQMVGSYNEFRPSLLSDLLKAFPNEGIEVTPAREYSVAVYLHIPDAGDLRSRVESFAREHFLADEVDWEEPGTLRCWWD